MDTPFLALSTLYLVVLVVALASALVARSAARDARAQLSNLWRQIESLHADQAALLIRAKRIEGRQTARLGRDQVNAADPSGLPDPNVNPDAWRAAVRRRIRRQLPPFHLKGGSVSQRGPVNFPAYSFLSQKSFSRCRPLGGGAPSEILGP